MKQREIFLSYGKQTIDEDDIEAVVATLRSPFLTQGPKIEEFERAVADYVGAKYAVAFANGTAALHGAYDAAGVGTGDEIITTPITFAATANAALYCGGTPVFADIDPVTYNLSPEAVAKKITDKTKVIAPVDFTGQPVDIDVFMEFAEAHDVVIVQDGAHSLGATYKGKRVGSQAHMTMFSFHPVKPITTGEGGIITTNSEVFYQRLKTFRSHGIAKTEYAKEQGDWYYEMTQLGYNYRMNDIQAALGLSQLNKIDAFLNRRQEIAKQYDNLLKDIPGIITPTLHKDVTSGWHLYMIQLDHKIKKSRKEIFNEMRAANIGVHVHYIPVYWHPYYKELGYECEICPIAEAWYERAMTLPIHPQMTGEDIKQVVKILKSVIESK